VSSGGAGLLAKALEKQCPDGHVAALEGHHSAHMADGLMLEEEEEQQLLEFKETAGEVGSRDAYGSNREPTLHHKVRHRIRPNNSLVGFKTAYCQAFNGEAGPEADVGTVRPDLTKQFMRKRGQPLGRVYAFMAVVCAKRACLVHDRSAE